MLKRVLILSSCFGVALLVVTLAGALVWKTRLEQRTFITDGQSIRVQAAQASPRSVMWTPPLPLGDAVNTLAQEFQPHISVDGLTMLMVRRSGAGEAAIYESRRATAASAWAEPQPVIELHSHEDDVSPALAPDGRSVYFASNRRGSLGGFDLWVSRRGDFGWLPPENLGPLINSAADEVDPAFAPGGKRIFFASNRSKGDVATGPQWPAPPPFNPAGEPADDFDIYVAEINPTDSDDSVSPAGAVALHTVNSLFHDIAPVASPVGDFLYFSSDRPGGFGRFDLYRTRVSGNEPQEPSNLGRKLNSSENELDPTLSGDGFVLHFSSDRIIESALAADRSVGDFNIFQSVTREVYTEIADAPPIDWASLWHIIGPSVVWLLLGLLALTLLLVALSMMRGARAQRLSLLARCLLASFIFHLALMILMTFWQVTTSISDMFERHGAMQVALISAPPRSDELFTQVRGGLTSVELAARDVEFNRAAAEIESEIAPTLVEVAVNELEQDQRDDSIAQLSSPNESQVELVLAASEARSQTTPKTVDVSAMAAPSPLTAQESAAAAPVMPVDTQRDRTGEEVPCMKGEPPSMAVALSPEQMTIDARDRSLASSQTTSDAEPLVEALKTKPTLIAASAEPISITAMAPPRTVQAQQPELALQALHASQAKTNIDVDHAAPRADHVRVQPHALRHTGDVRPLAKTSDHAKSQATAPALNQMTHAPEPTVAATTVAVQTAPESQRALAEETSLALEASQLPSARADASAELKTNQRVSRTNLAPQAVRAAPPTGGLVIAVAPRDASVPAMQAPLAAPSARNSQSDASVDLPMDDSRAVAMVEEVSPSLWVIESTTAPRTEVTPSVLGESAAHVEMTPATAPEAKSHVAAAISMTTFNVPSNERPIAFIDVQAPLATASRSNAALPDLSLPAGTLPRPAAGEETGAAVSIATASTQRQLPTTGRAPVIDAQHVEITPVPKTDSKFDSQSFASSTATFDAVPAQPLQASQSPASIASHKAEVNVDVAVPSGELTLANDSVMPKVLIVAANAATTHLRRSTDLSLAQAATRPTVEIRPSAPPQLTEEKQSFATINDAPQSGARHADASVLVSMDVGFRPPADLQHIALPQNDAIARAIPAVQLTHQSKPDEAKPLASISRAAIDTSYAHLEIDQVQFTPNASNEHASNTSLASTVRAQESVAATAESHEVATPAPALALAAVDIKTAPESESIPVMPPENPYPQRAEERRKELVKRGGGSEATEKAVALALEWLSKHQSDDGRWAARDFNKSCGDDCNGRAKFDTDVATTGLTLLCFLGADHTHVKDGPYREQIKRALDWMLTQQREDGDWRGGETMYSHGIATIAVCEAYAMTGDQRLAPAVKNAIDYIWAARNRSVGGWRYEPGQVGDTSVLGWQVMALMSAKRAGFFVPAEAFEMARHWLDLASTPARPGLYAYQPGQRFTPSMTAEGMFIQQLSGRDRHEDRMQQSANFLVQNLPVWRSDQNSYFWYYGTLALFQHQGEHWKQWNDALTKQLLANQRTEGHEAGSWDPTDQWAKIGGRVYQTALCTLCLEVYYRYLPMYAAVEEQ